jgi:hypothetical protein
LAYSATFLLQTNYFKIDQDIFDWNLHPLNLQGTRSQTKLIIKQACRVVNVNRCNTYSKKHSSGCSTPRRIINKLSLGWANA